ncbi:MAG: glycosyltransferase [Flavobacteriales bacterium]|nr:glycosyltransferase [Flavobacteriales bacterium]
MRITFLSTFPPFRGGIAHFNDRFAEELLARGHQVRAITFTRQYPALLFPGRTQKEEGAPIGTPAVEAEPLVDSIGPISWFRTAKRIRRQAPDVVILRYWIGFFAPCYWSIVRLVKRGRRPKVIYLVDNFIPHEQRLGETLLRRLAFRVADGCMVLSSVVEAQVRQAYPALPVTCSPHPIYDRFGAAMDPVQARAELGLPPGARVLLFFGFIRPYKGLDQLLEAFPKIAAADPDVHLVVAGECYHGEAELREQARTSGTADRIHLHLGYIASERIATFFSASEVLVLPYRSATQSGIVQIAHHFELPCIVTDVGGLAEVVIEGRTGHVVPAGNKAALADRVIRFLRERIDMRPGLRDARKRYQWSTFTESFERLVDRVK